MTAYRIEGRPVDVIWQYHWHIQTWRSQDGLCCLSPLLFSVCIFILSLWCRSVLRCYMCVQLWPQAKEISSLPYTRMCVQCPQIQHTGMIVPVKNPEEWFQIVLSWIIMPISRPISWIQFTNYKYSNLGHMAVPGIRDQVLKDSLADKDNRHYNSQKKKKKYWLE